MERRLKGGKSTIHIQKQFYLETHMCGANFDFRGIKMNHLNVHCEKTKTKPDSYMFTARDIAETGREAKPQISKFSRRKIRGN